MGRIGLISGEYGDRFHVNDRDSRIIWFRASSLTIALDPWVLGDDYSQLHIAVKTTVC
ncbi:hypothetical protein ES703_69229 [subsurface metagenome]